MADFRVTLTLENTEIEFPILPPVLKVRSAGKNQKVDLLKLSEVTIIKPKGLKEIGWECYFPAYSQNSLIKDLPVLVYTSANLGANSPMQLVKAIQRQRDAEKPARLSLVGFDLDVNMQVAIQQFDYEERFGELGDIYYTISLREWVDYSPKKARIEEGADGSAQVVLEEPERSGIAPDLPQTNGQGGSKTYVVQEGDNLWTISKKIYDDDTKYTKLYELNKAQLSSGNQTNRAFLYDLKAGQVLDLP